MPDGSAKQRVIRALKRKPDLVGTAFLPPPGSRQGGQLLQWLDQSGLALALLNCAGIRAAGANLSDEWREMLEERKKRNAARLQDMLEEFRRLNNAFRAQGVMVVTLKGFSLIPDFCEDPILRHQTDFDFLVNPGDVDAAAEVLRSCGYSTPRLSYSEESCFTTPLHHIPSRADDLYAIQHHRQVDLHVSMIESPPWLQVDFSGLTTEAATPMSVSGINFKGLSLENRFLVQVLHAFRHSFRSWVRLSWLMEIARCVNLHHGDDALWSRLIERAGDQPLTKRVFAFVLSLTDRLFDAPIPSGIANWIAGAMTPSLLAWLDHFSVNWAIAGWPGSLSNLFLASDFIADARLRREYLMSRLIPKRERLTIEAQASDQPARPIAWQIQRWRYVAHRTGVHLGDLIRLPLEQWRWQRALGSAQARLDQVQS